MNLREFQASLNKFIGENPECIEMQVIYSKDDEGNGFNKVHYEPTKGVYCKYELDFQTEDIEVSNINSVCIN